jgi:SAM-dependent methyltransferase
MKQLCPLCHSSNHQNFAQDERREYRQCATCQLIFVPSSFYLDAPAEKARYDLHTNNPHDINYRKFLYRMLAPIDERIDKNSQGLDFGSGPGPTLSLMFEEAGHEMEIYDLFYANNLHVFEKEYDFITTTEVIEHLHHPYDELQRLWNCLKPGGFLGVMTSRYDSIENFDTWHYKLDPTHICFFSISSFRWLQQQWHAYLHIIDNDIVILEKKQTTD